MASSAVTPQQQELGQVGQFIGIGTGVASTTGTALGMGATGLLGGAVGAATLGIGAAAAIIASLVFHGADPNQVPAAKINQTFIGASDKLAAAHANGMITKEQATSGMEWLKSEAQALWQQYPTLAGSTNSKISSTLSQIDSVVTAEESGAKMQVPDNITVEINPDAVSGYYPTAGTSGWYSDSIKAANQIASTYLSSLPKNFPTTAESTSQVVSDLTSGNLAQLGTDISKSGLFLWGGIILVGMGLWHAFAK